MIPVFVASGHRAVAPDMYGFGRSDKPAQDETYTFDFHRGALMAYVKRLDLKNITLVCQDWGGLLGLTLPMDMPGRFTRLLLMNTTLGTGDVKLSGGFLAWRAWCNEHPDMEIGKLMGRACPHLTDLEKAAYDAPFPDVGYKGGVRRFPNLIPDHPQAPGAAVSQRARTWLQGEWGGASFMAIGMQDPVLGPPVMHALRKRIRGCPEPLEVHEAGHFVQEWGGRVAEKALEAFE
jgi:pimeloyl-ACP methyl ester carboxylesterase